jgi:hypothetical protein
MSTLFSTMRKGRLRSFFHRHLVVSSTSIAKQIKEPSKFVILILGAAKYFKTLNAFTSFLGHVNGTDLEELRANYFVGKAKSARTLSISQSNLMISQTFAIAKLKYITITLF